jgi:hypothetical protein
MEPGIWSLNLQGFACFWILEHVMGRRFVVRGSGHLKRVFGGSGPQNNIFTRKLLFKLGFKFGTYFPQAPGSGFQVPGCSLVKGSWVEGSWVENSWVEGSWFVAPDT